MGRGASVRADQALAVPVEPCGLAPPGFDPLREPNYPPAPHAHRLAVMLAAGEHERAQRLLDDLSAFPVAFGRPPFDMPEPFAGPMEGLVIASADVALEPVRLGEQRWGVAA
jgi:hypothetical protein